MFLVCSVTGRVIDRRKSFTPCGLLSVINSIRIDKVGVDDILLVATGDSNVYMYYLGDEPSPQLPVIFNNNEDTWSLSSRLRLDCGPPRLVVAAGSNAHLITEWELQNGSRAMRRFAGHTNNIPAVEIIPDETARFAASVSIDQSIRIWDSRTGNCVAGFEGTEWCWSVIWIPLNEIPSRSKQEDADIQQIGFSPGINSALVTGLVDCEGAAQLSRFILLVGRATSTIGYRIVFSPSSTTENEILHWTNWNEIKRENQSTGLFNKRENQSTGLFFNCKLVEELALRVYETAHYYERLSLVKWDAGLAMVVLISMTSGLLRTARLQRIPSTDRVICAEEQTTLLRDSNQEVCWGTTRAGVTPLAEGNTNNTKASGDDTFIRNLIAMEDVLQVSSNVLTNVMVNGMAIHTVRREGKTFLRVYLVDADGILFGFHIFPDATKIPKRHTSSM